MKKTYIYGLIDPRDNKIKYIGKSNDPIKRLKSHIYNSINNKKKRTKKENWIIKLINNFLQPEIKILIECEYDKHEYWEEYYIKKYETFNENNYDIFGKGKISNPINLGVINKKKLSKKILKYDVDGRFICEYQSLRNAEKLSGISHGNISKACRGIYKHAGGFIFKYENDYNTVKKINGSLNARKKPVILYDKNNRILNEYKSITEASKKTGIDAGHISKICNNKIKSNKRFKFK